EQHIGLAINFTGGGDAMTCRRGRCRDGHGDSAGGGDELGIRCRSCVPCVLFHLLGGNGGGRDHEPRSSGQGQAAPWATAAARGPAGRVRAGRAAAAVMIWSSAKPAGVPRARHLPGYSVTLRIWPAEPSASPCIQQPPYKQAVMACNFNR